MGNENEEGLLGRGGGVQDRNRSMKDANRWRKACGKKSPVLLLGGLKQVRGVGSNGVVVALIHPSVDRDASWR